MKSKPQLVASPMDSNAAEDADGAVVGVISLGNVLPIAETAGLRWLRKVDRKSSHQ